VDFVVGVGYPFPFDPVISSFHNHDCHFRLRGILQSRLTSSLLILSLDLHKNGAKDFWKTLGTIRSFSGHRSYLPICQPISMKE